MSNYIFAYHGGKKPDSQEESAKVMARWNEWLDNLGSAVINPGAPVGLSKTVSAKGVADDGGANPLSGFSIVEAGSMEAALKMVEGCPHLDNGTVEVAEIMKM